MLIEFRVEINVWLTIQGHCPDVIITDNGVNIEKAVEYGKCAYLSDPAWA